MSGGSWFFICFLHTAEVVDSLVEIRVSPKWQTTFKMQGGGYIDLKDKENFYLK